MYQRVKQAKLLKILIQEQALVRLLKTIGDKEYHTRELLKKMGAYGYGHKLLLEAERKGLVKRTIVKNRMYNRLTKKGKDVIKLAKQIGV
jgi:DNA-binding HxlR family transcriptional regulator